MKKDIVKVYLLQLLTVVVSFLASIFMTRILGSEGRGSFAIYSNASSFAVILFGFSIASTIPYYLNFKKISAEKIFFTSLSVLFCNLFLLILSIGLISYFQHTNFIIPEDKLLYKVVFVAFFLFQLVYSILITLLNAYKKFIWVGLLNIFNIAIPFIFYCLIYFKIFDIKQEQDFLAVILFLLAAIIGSTGIGFYLFVRVSKFKFSFQLMSLLEAKEFILYSMLAYFGNIATFICYKLDFWVVDAYQGKAALGVYSLASQLTQMLWILPQTMASILYTYAASASEKEALQYTITLKKIATLITLVFAAIGMLLAIPLIPVLYGNEFEPTSKLLAIQIIGAIPFCIPTILASFYASRGNFKISFYISVFVSLISMVLYFTFIPMWGSKGGAIASSCTYFLGAFISEYYFCRRYQISPKDLYSFSKKDIVFVKSFFAKK